MAGCGGQNCACKIVSGTRTRVSGNGNTNNPYVVDAYPVSLVVSNTGTVELTLSGAGTDADPWVVTADLATGALDAFWQAWSGTQAAYNALGSYDTSVLYLITDA